MMAESREKSERRAGNDRRRINNGAASGAALLLLAKLTATLIGTLVGFAAAYLISVIFVADFQQLLSDGQEKLRSIEQDLVDLEPDFTKARDEYWRLRPEPGDIIKETGQAPAGSQRPVVPQEGGTATPVPPASAPPYAGQPGQNGGEELERARTLYEDYRHRRDTLKNSENFWNEQNRELIRNINLFNAISTAVVLILTLVGYLLYPLILGGIKRLNFQWSELIAGPEARTTQAVIGFFFGVVIAVVLLLAIFNTLSTAHSIFSFAWFRLLSGLLVVSVLGVAGSTIGVTFFGPPAKEQDPFLEYREMSPPKVLDTSVIIDGRVKEVAATGFLGGALVINNSVLRELQNLADSADERKRVKGRRGLELVRNMQDDPRIDIRVFNDTRFDNQAHSTDEQLIIAAQAMKGVVVTNDYNLNRVASIRNVRVINLNALANAVKTNHLPGDFIEISIVDHGKQHGQGVGYLADGTMVVVEDGEPYIHNTMTIKLTSVTQTVQGRMLFGRVDAAEAEGYKNG